MEVLLTVPDDIVERLHVRSEELSRHALESLATDFYRSGLLSHAEVQQMLGFETRFETDAFLKERGAYLDYNEEDFAKDLETLRGLPE
jgi:predicted HTH domain antitoxin